MKTFLWAITGQSEKFVIPKHLVHTLRTGLYLIIAVGLAVFLYSLGLDPWQHAVGKKWLFLQVALISCLAILVQAQSFRAVQPVNCKSLGFVRMTGIWSFSAMISVVAPFVAGIATRTTLLVRAGMPLTMCVTTTLRQLWMGLEYAFLIGGFAAIVWQHEKSAYLAGSLLTLGFFMVVIRKARSLAAWNIPDSKWYKSLDFLQEVITLRAHFWFIAQIGAMTATYLVVFNGFGASLGLTEALLLSSATILASLMIIVPNGLGIMDTMWVMVATRAGLDINTSAALAIVMRLSHFCAAIIISATSNALNIRVKARGRRGNNGCR